MGICSQRLLPRAGGGLVAAFEVLVASYAGGPDLYYPLAFVSSITPAGKPAKKPVKKASKPAKK